MSNVLRISHEPEKEKTVGDMLVGDWGFVVPWAYNGKNIDTTFSIFNKQFGTASLHVLCVDDGKYNLDYDFHRSKLPTLEIAEDYQEARME